MVSPRIARKETSLLNLFTAWQVDFNVSLASLEPLVHGTRRLVDFALSCRVAPRFVFTSSAGVFRSTSICLLC